MARFYRDRARAERPVILWLELTADICRTAPRERFTMLSHDIRHASRLLLKPAMTFSLTA
jgi:hypothetical protein